MFDVETGEFPRLLKKKKHGVKPQFHHVSPIVGSNFRCFNHWEWSKKASRLRQATEAGVDPHMNDQTSLANGARSSHRGPGEIYDSSMKPPNSEKVTPKSPKK